MRALAAAGVLVLAQAQQPDPFDLIARMKAGADRYSSNLANFLCTQQMVRHTARLEERPRWKKLETQELQVAYANRRPRYTLVKVNGKRDKLNQRIRHNGDYFTPGGEFGAIDWVFDPDARADFTWDRREAGLCVIAYRIPYERTNAQFNVNAQPIRAAHAGFVHVDCTTAEIRRIEVETEPAYAAFGRARIPINMRLDITYEKTPIGDAQYLLPKDAELTGRFNVTLTRAQIDFEQYRKYDASSTITFMDEAAEADRLN